ncbi:HAMP domain-containing sensor histidine kinase [Colwellia sp. Bg11-12]|uniref:sensor histidine kinase n=1 Tax=Colwellia sp. Bg11-12 TaxID=2759817 RepID=UPI0015F43724|nr:HAMP domain-containing sensor histidine kinase [Colwellia sp. Bg11-12]MBA6264075.1 HAMP domain-containing histidine kinase [Colwellia sp. Bg11-12]
MSLFFRKFNQVRTVLLLRSVAIIIQLILIFFVNVILAYQLPWLPLIIVIFSEILFTLASYLYYRSGKEADKFALLGQVCADILFLALILYYSGGATNAFVSLLLIPIAIAAVTLPPLMLGGVALLAIASYSVLLWLLPMSVMHGNMESHFIGMWINFLFSSIVVATVVGRMARRISQKELAIAAFREEQLKQEKVMSLGVASAQITHQLATPIATVQLLVDELSDELPEHPVVADLQLQLLRCSESLAEFREMVFEIKEQKSKVVYCTDIIKQVAEHISLNYPEISANFLPNNNQSPLGKSAEILADASLLPAILNLVNNAVQATKMNNSDRIELSSACDQINWLLSIRDFGRGFTPSTLSELGVKPVNSKHGLGMAVFLSHASLERLGGRLTLTNHLDGGALVTLKLPLITDGM